MAKAQNGEQRGFARRADGRVLLFGSVHQLGQENFEEIGRQGRVNVSAEIVARLGHQLFHFVAGVIERLGERLSQWSEERYRTTGVAAGFQLLEKEPDGADAVTGMIRTCSSIGIWSVVR